MRGHATAGAFPADLGGDILYLEIRSYPSLILQQDEREASISRLQMADPSADELLGRLNDLKREVADAKLDW